MAGVVCMLSVCGWCCLHVERLWLVLFSPQGQNMTERPYLLPSTIGMCVRLCGVCDGVVERWLVELRGMCVRAYVCVCDGVVEQWLVELVE